MLSPRLNRRPDTARSDQEGGEAPHPISPPIPQYPLPRPARSRTLPELIWPEITGNLLPSYSDPHSSPLSSRLEQYLGDAKRLHRLIGGGRMNKTRATASETDSLFRQSACHTREENPERHACALTPKGTHPRSISTRVQYGGNLNGDGRNVVEHVHVIASACNP